MSVGAGGSYKDHYGNLRTWWNYCSRKGWVDKDEFNRVDEPRRRNPARIRTLTPAEIRKLFKLAEGKFPDVAAAYAVLLFSGCRFVEAGRMIWGDFTDDGLRIFADVAKASMARLVPWSVPLRAWVEAHGGPQDQPIIPANYENKSDWVRAEAGWKIYSRLHKKTLHPEGSEWPRNVWRKTHASVQVALGMPLQDLVFQFGHSQGLATLRRYYAGVITRKVAVEIMRIGPGGKKLPAIRAA